MNTFLRAVNWVMCALFLLSVLVQWNDPDPLRWVAIYGAALVVCLVVAFRGRIWTAAPPAGGGQEDAVCSEAEPSHRCSLVRGAASLVMTFALVWSVATMTGGPAVNAYAHMLDAWEMKSISVEEAREGTGLLIVAGWMLVIAVAERPSTSLRPAPSIAEGRRAARTK